MPEWEKDRERSGCNIRHPLHQRQVYDVSFIKCLEAIHSENFLRYFIIYAAHKMFSYSPEKKTRTE